MPRIFFFMINAKSTGARSRAISCFQKKFDDLKRSGNRERRWFTKILVNWAQYSWTWPQDRPSTLCPWTSVNLSLNSRSDDWSSSRRAPRHDTRPFLTVCSARFLPAPKEVIKVTAPPILSTGAFAVRVLAKSVYCPSAVVVSGVEPHAV